MSLHSEHEFYDYDKADEAIELIENKVAELIGHDEADLNKATQREFETLIEDGEIPTTPNRNLDGYEEKLSIQLAGRVLILGENPKTDVPYLVCLAKRDNPLNIEEYYNAAVTYDYLEAMRRFTDELDTLLIGLEQERAAFPTIQPTLTAADCVPNGLNEDLKGKLVVIKPEVLSPEYRTADHQLKIVQGGFGASPNARGNAVFCKDLYSDKETRFERYDIAGVIDPAKLPEWAKQKLAPVKEQIKPAPTKPKPAKQAELPQKKPSILDDLDASVQEAAQLAERKGRPTKKRGDLEVD
jgi:hypothetical protein